MVGPNGSGKSNVVDALAWVMGEQGAKTLRGGKMEDVIFAGTATKGPLGRAEVQLTIDNSDGALPIEYSEVTISRVLFRNGASEYAINGETCRLLDVQELLSDSGLGREMHVIVGQGQLDLVLRATPIERRAFVEEAAGILKFRRRKEKTERKLEAMQVNLTRLQDLIAELRRNLKPLGRQAEVARQAKDIGAIAREAKAKLFAFQITEVRTQLEMSSKSEGDRKTDAAFVQNQLAAARQGIQDLEKLLVSEELDKLRKRLFAFESLESKLRGLQNLAQQKISLLGQQEFTSREIEVAQLANELESAESQLASLEQEIEQVAALLREREASRQQEVSALAEFEADALRKRSEAEGHELARSQAQNKVSALESKIEGLKSQLQGLRQAHEEATARISDLEILQADFSLTAADVSDEGFRKAYDLAQQAELEARAELERLRDELHAVERERDAVAARHSALGLTLQQNDGATEVSKAELQGVRGLLADSMSVDRGYEAAIAAALGLLANAVVVESRKHAVGAIGFLKSGDLGQAGFLILGSGREKSVEPEIAGLTPAVNVVTAPDFIRSSLSKTYIAQNLDQAISAIDDKGLQGARIVTMQGELVSEHLIQGGSDKQPSKLELSAQRDDAAARLKDLAKEIEVKAAHLLEGKGALELTEQQSRVALSNLQQHDAELAARAERAGRNLAQIESAKAEALRIYADIERVGSLLHEGEQALSTALAELAQLPAAIKVEEDQEVRQSLVHRLEQARQQELDLRVQVSALAERRSAASKDVAITKGRLSEAQQGIERERQASQLRMQQLESAQTALGLIPLALKRAEVSATELRVSLRNLEAERIQHMDRLTLLRQQATGLEQRFTELNQSVHEVEMQNHELKIQLANLSEKVSNELHLDVDTLLAETEPGEANREDLEKQLRQAEQKLSQLGAFNPLALEEFAALEERHKYLSEQLEDLTKARSDLVGIIKDLDVKMQTVFAAAFEDTKREFEKVFPILFPGGTGSISLTEPDDMLTTGIEVAVRPVGKRIERMSLLSGGERSLAAVALLIAIFKARPSPFYVLDEVEAALDDANLGRLLEVIESLRRSSQLIVVTHQKRTMEIADALYGVSMRQDGMSAVVGQKLEKSNV